MFKKVKEWLKVKADEDLLASTHLLAVQVMEEKKKSTAIAHDYAIELKESADNQLQMDLFQQALTNKFTEAEITAFFDECDRLREVHDHAKANSS